MQRNLQMHLIGDTTAYKAWAHFPRITLPAEMPDQTLAQQLAKTHWGCHCLCINSLCPQRTLCALHCSHAQVCL